MYIDFEKNSGLVPVIIQSETNLQVLMLGYMNEAAYQKTLEEGIVTFFSRSKNRLWTKGETSGNCLNVSEIKVDCDNDAILIKVTPQGPVCHTGSAACFGPKETKGFIYDLEKTIQDKISADDATSYTNKLFKSGINKVAQKVGEEAVEVILEAKDDNASLFRNEVADLLYHLLILLRMKDVKLSEVEEILIERSMG